MIRGERPFDRLSPVSGKRSRRQPRRVTYTFVVVCKTLLRNFRLDTINAHKIHSIYVHTIAFNRNILF